MHGVATPSGPGPHRYRSFMITQLHTLQSVWLLWMSDRPDAGTSTWKHNIHKRQTSMPPVVFESAIPASMRPHTHAFDRAATVISCMVYSFQGFCTLSSSNGSGTRMEFIPLCYSYWNLTLLNRYFDRTIWISSPFPKYCWNLIKFKLVGNRCYGSNILVLLYQLYEMECLQRQKEKINICKENCATPAPQTKTKQTSIKSPLSL
jgi:hypothetical protein